MLEISVIATCFNNSLKRQTTSKRLSAVCYFARLLRKEAFKLEMVSAKILISSEEQSSVIRLISFLNT
jgi:hypothetical protein